MKKYKVDGKIEVAITVIVEAESEEDAREEVFNVYEGLQNYCGNGGVDQLVGVNDSRISLSCDYGNEIDIDSVEQANE